MIFVLRLFARVLGRRTFDWRDPRIRLPAVLCLGAALIGLLWLTPWFQKLLYPLPHRDLIFEYSRQYEIDPYLVAAVIRNESKFLPTAKSEQGARGLMQLMPGTAQWIAQTMDWRDYRSEQLYEPRVNIRMGCWYLASLKKEFHGQVPLMIAAYNGGRGNVREWLLTQQWSGQGDQLENIPFSETREYVKRVLRDYQRYKEIYREG